MKPSARQQAVVELLDEFQGSNLALNVLAGNYFRKRRYIGSKDRRAIKDTLYNVMRDYIRIGWMLENAGAKITARARLLGHMFLTGGLKDELFSGDKYGLAPLSKDEANFLKKINEDDMPPWARLNCPQWLEEGFRVRFGSAFESEMAALNDRAPLCLRVNTLKTSVKKIAPDLAEAGFTKTRLSSVGFSSPENIPLHDMQGFQDGYFEVQDEGSQVAAGLVGARPGHQVLDYCAGAGGKTLALAAAMQNKGQIFAYDVDGKRLQTLQKRAQRAGVRNVQVVEKDNLLALSGKMDRVLVDVPCSGTGVWRRSPDLRARVTPEKVASYLKIQKQLLENGATYVKPGGAMVYVTCSLLRQENEDQVTGFLKSQAGWNLLAIGPPVKNNAAALEGTLQLTPARHSADGFFVAVLSRAPALRANRDGRGGQ